MPPQSVPRRGTPRLSGLPLVLASLVVASGLVVLVWFDYAATRHELLGLVREHALALRETVAAAARSNRAAAAFSTTQLGERLLAQARELAALDSQDRLTSAVVDDVVRGTPLFRVMVFSADGTPEGRLMTAGATAVAGQGPGAGRGPGMGPGMGRGGHGPGAGGSGGSLGPGRGRGPGAGGPGGGQHGAGQVVREILDDGKQEVVTGLHAPRWGGGGRVAAGVRRARGGAIVLTVDATAIAQLEAPASLDSLLGEITRSSPGIAYTVFEHDGGRLAFGETPADEGAASGERELDVAGRPVLEFASEVPTGAEAPARLRLGMRLDDVRGVERRMAVRLVVSLLVSVALVALAFNLAGLGRRYGALSARHARAEEALRRRDRLSAMGELASTVAHEIRNPLNAIGMTAQRLRREFLDIVPADGPDRPELMELLGVMSSETQRINRIVQQFLDYARPPRLAPQPTHIGEMVSALAERTRPLAEARGVQIATDVSAAGKALVDASQLQQALDNLVRNAIDASPQGGRVDVAARCERDGCTIEVKDGGPGIAPEHLPKIFDLYFTTKADGTGVGLAVTQQIVTAHGGTIEVDSRPGAGTTMTVRLPKAEDAA